jgi:hypothetical protein
VSTLFVSVVYMKCHLSEYIIRACRIAWHPEACDFVIEGVPSQPYGFLPSHFNTVEANMRLRREQVQKILSEQSDCEFILNIAAFPG